MLKFGSRSAWDQTTKMAKEIRLLVLYEVKCQHLSYLSLPQLFGLKEIAPISIVKTWQVLRPKHKAFGTNYEHCTVGYHKLDFLFLLLVLGMYFLS